VLRTESEDDTTELLAVIAGREQSTADREVSVHGEKGTKTLSEQQEYVVASIAEIGPVTARSLLEEFGTVEGVMIATEDELQAADGVGRVTAERIREVIGSDYRLTPTRPAAQSLASGGDPVLALVADGSGADLPPRG